MAALAPPTTRRRQPQRSTTPPASLRPLALIEARRLLTRPTVLVGASLSLLLMVTGTWSLAPVLNRDDTAASGALLVLAAATLLAANRAVLRSRRHGTDELLGTVATAPAVRTSAVLVATTAPAVLGAVCAGAFLLWRMSGDPVASPDPFELLTGPVLVLLGGCAGVALGRWAPSVAVAPVAVVGLAALEFVLTLGTFGGESGGRGKWLAPFVGQQGVARELLVRPTGWHLLYLGALIVLVACLALLRHGPSPDVGTIAAVATAVAVTSAGVQLRPLPLEQRPAALAAELSREARDNCRQHAGVTYCAVPSYEAWIDDWRATVDRVLTTVPASARPRGLVVRQDVLGSDVESLDESPPGQDAPTATEVRPSLWWGSGTGDGPYRFGMALGVASLAVGLSPDGTTEGDGLATCSVVGQSRGVVALWLAAQSGARTVEHLDGVLAAQRDAAVAADFPGIYFDGRQGQPIGALEFGLAEAVAAAELADRPRADVARQLTRRWDVLTAPATPTGRARALLGLRDPVPATSAGAARDLQAPGGATADAWLPPCS